MREVTPPYGLRGIVVFFFHFLTPLHFPSVASGSEAFARK